MSLGRMFGPSACFETGSASTEPKAQFECRYCRLPAQQAHTRGWGRGVCQRHQCGQAGRVFRLKHNVSILNWACTSTMKWHVAQHRRALIIDYFRHLKRGIQCNLVELMFGCNLVELMTYGWSVLLSTRIATIWSPLLIGAGESGTRPNVL